MPLCPETGAPAAAVAHRSIDTLCRSAAVAGVDQGRTHGARDRLVVGGAGGLVAGGADTGSVGAGRGSGLRKQRLVASVGGGTGVVSGRESVCSSWRHRRRLCGARQTTGWALRVAGGGCVVLRKSPATQPVAPGLIAPPLSRGVRRSPAPWPVAVIAVPSGKHTGRARQRGRVPCAGLAPLAVGIGDVDRLLGRRQCCRGWRYCRRRRWAGSERPSAFGGIVATAHKRARQPEAARLVVAGGRRSRAGDEQHQCATDDSQDAWRDNPKPMYASLRPHCGEHPIEICLSRQTVSVRQLPYRRHE